MKNKEENGFAESLTDEQIQVAGKLTGWIVAHRMTTPAILFLESVRPLNFVGSQVMVFFQPVVQIIFNRPEWDEFRKILENRESISYLLDLIEEKENEYLVNLKRSKKQGKEKKTDGK